MRKRGTKTVTTTNSRCISSLKRKHSYVGSGIVNGGLTIKDRVFPNGQRNRLNQFRKTVLADRSNIHSRTRNRFWTKTNDSSFSSGCNGYTQGGGGWNIKTDYRNTDIRIFRDYDGNSSVGAGGRRSYFKNRQRKNGQFGNRYFGFKNSRN